MTKRQVINSEVKRLKGLSLSLPITRAEALTLISVTVWTCRQFTEVDILGIIREVTIKVNHLS